MTARNRRRSTRRALRLLTAFGALAASATPAAAGPVLNTGPVGWSTVSGHAGPFASADGGSTISSPAGAPIPAGSHYQTQYCNPYGANTRLVAATVRRVRWQATANDIFAYMRIQNPAGTDVATRYLYNNITALEMQQGAVHDDAVNFASGPGQCFWGGVYANGSSSPAFGSLMTNAIMNVQVEDLEAPAAWGARTQPGWFTGDAAVAWWTQSDNGLFRGNTYASIPDAGTTVDLGDQPNGEVGAWVGVGAIADGAHQICGNRASSGWATAQSCVSFLLDRTDPAAPQVTLTPDTDEAWTNQNVTVTTTATGDGTGSGWDRNQFRYDTGAWQDSAPTFVRSPEGQVSLTARAIDKAGRASPASVLRTIRIDKTPPVAQITIAARPEPGLVNLSKGATGDRLSGLRRWEVRLGAVDGPVVADTDAELSNIGQSAPAATAGQTRLFLIAEDNAGNRSTAATPIIQVGTPPAPSVTVVSADDAPSFVATGLRADARAGTRSVDGRVLPVIRRTYDRRFALRGHLQSPDGSPLAAVGVELRDSAGRYAAGTRTDENGDIRLSARATIGGVWTVGLVGKPGRVAAALLEVKPLATARMRMVSSRGDRRLMVTGRLAPGAGADGKAIQLQWHDGIARWRPALNGRVRRDGSFRMTYRFTKPGGYSIRFRVSVPTDNGWPYLATTSRPIRLRVR